MVFVPLMFTVLANISIACYVSLSTNKVLSLSFSDQTLHEREWTRDQLRHLTSTLKEPGQHIKFLMSLSVTILICHFINRSQSIGSANLDQLPPRSPRLSTIAMPNYSPSTTGYYTYSSATPSPGRGRKVSYAGTEHISATLQPGTSSPNLPTPWKRKLSKTMKHLAVSPRFHRKRYEGQPESAANTEFTHSPQMYVCMCAYVWSSFICVYDV